MVGGWGRGGWGAGGWGGGGAGGGETKGLLGRLGREISPGNKVKTRHFHLHYGRECKRHCQAGCQIAQTFAIIGQERSLRFARSSSHYCPYFSVITGFFRYPVMSAAKQHYPIFFHFCLSLHFQSFLYLHLTRA